MTHYLLFNRHASTFLIGIKPWFKSETVMSVHYSRSPSEGGPTCLGPGNLLMIASLSSLEGITEARPKEVYNPWARPGGKEHKSLSTKFTLTFFSARVVSFSHI